MQSVENLTHRFEKHFQPGQADVLAEVIHESLTDIKKTPDITELQDIGTDLTDSHNELYEEFFFTLEEFAIDLVPEILENQWGMIIEFAGHEDLKVRSRKRKFDLVIRGTINEKPVLVLGKVKSSFTEIQAQRFLKTTDRFAKENPGQEVRTIFFGYKAKRAAREAIQAAGAYMISTRGQFV